MTLQAWIKKTGPKKVAKLLSVEPQTVSAWRTFRACPRPAKMHQIKKVTRGLVRYKDMIEPFVSATSKGK